jgi:hypothetical protein
MSEKPNNTIMVVLITDREYVRVMFIVLDFFKNPT